MWPRMPRPELALLFPNGHSKYVPDDGGPITPRDVKVAQSKNRDLAVQVAAFFHDRLTPGTSRTMVASAEIKLPKPRLPWWRRSAAKPRQVDPTRRNVSLTTEPDPSLTEPKPFAPARVASLSPADSDDDPPNLISKPQPVERASRFVPSPSKSDRGKLDALVTAAANMPMPQLVAGPKPAIRPQKGLAAAALAEKGVSPRQPTAQVASLDPG